MFSTIEFDTEIYILRCIIQYVEGTNNTSIAANMPIKITYITTHVSVEICVKFVPGGKDINLPVW